MTYDIGDPNHLGVHNDLVTQTRDLASLFGVDVTLPPIRALGESGHVADHNLIRQALEKIAADAVTPPAAIDETAGGSWIDRLTNGVVYRVGTFTGNATLRITRAGELEYLVVGGGSSGGGEYASHGAGGSVVRGTIVIPAGDHAITIGGGAGGGGATGTSNGGNVGGYSALGVLITATRTNGYNSGGVGAPYTTDISGVSVTYAQTANNSTPGGGGARAACCGAPPGQNGAAGIVLVRRKKG